MKEKEKGVKSYRVDKSLRPVGAAYEPVQKYKVTPGILGDLIMYMSQQLSSFSIYKIAIWSDHYI